MDPIKIEKAQANKRYNSMSENILSSLIQNSLVVVMFGLFLSGLLWLPTLCSSLKLFFLESLPKMIVIFFSPKCVFVIFNLIIIFLVGESRLSSSSPKPDIYEEYMIHHQSLKGLSSSEDKGKESVLESPLVEEKKEKEKEEVEEKEEEEKELKEESEGLEEEEEEEEEKEEKGLPAEELNKRVEDFIAKVNMQRRLEARTLVCCR